MIPIEFLSPEEPAAQVLFSTEVCATVSVLFLFVQPKSTFLWIVLSDKRIERWHICAVGVRAGANVYPTISTFFNRVYIECSI